MNTLRYAFFFVLALILISCGSDNSGPDTTLYDVSISVAPDGAGTIAPVADSSYEAGSTVSLQANAGDEFHFASWTGDLESNDNPLSLTVDQDYILTANFITTEELFYLHENGVTVMCPHAEPGQKGVVDGTEYEAVDDTLLKQKIDEGNEGDLSNVCTSPVTKMHRMFAGASSFNGDISSWDVSKVKDMDWMFYEAMSFTQDLSGWCVPNVGEEPYNFSFGSSLSNEHHPVWGTCP